MIRAYCRPKRDDEVKASTVYRGASSILRELASVPHRDGAEFSDVRSKLSLRLKELLQGAYCVEVLEVAGGTLKKQFVPVLQVPDGDEDFFAALGTGDSERAVACLQRMPVKGVG